DRCNGPTSTRHGPNSRMLADASQYTIATKLTTRDASPHNPAGAAVSPDRRVMKMSATPATNNAAVPTPGNSSPSGLQKTRTQPQNVSSSGAQRTAPTSALND